MMKRCMAALGSLVAVLGHVGAQEASFWLPEQGSNLAPTVDWLFLFITRIGIFFFVLIVFLMVLFVVRYRRREEDEIPSYQRHHNLSLELVWTVLPAVLLVFIYVKGLLAYMDAFTPPRQSYQIGVVARQWSWSFRYPEGFTSDRLVLPVSRPVTVTMRSEDVIHSFYIPAFRVKQDVVPGRYTKLWFIATHETPEDRPHLLYCAEYCGAGHSFMMAEVHVKSEEGFAAWILSETDISGLPAHERGDRIMRGAGCFGCHSRDGRPLIGPTYQGLWGKEESLEGGGKVLVDEDYIRRSILDPRADVVLGYVPNMPTYKGQLSDAEIDDIISYLRALVEGVPEPPPEEPPPEDEPGPPPEDENAPDDGPGGEQDR